MNKDVWQYIDPDKTLHADQQKPVKPIPPIITRDDIPAVSQLAIITYQQSCKEYRDKVNALDKLDTKIFNTVSETYRGYLREDTIYLNLVKLKNYVALNTPNCILVLQNEYSLLLKGPKHNKVPDWLN